MRKPIQKPFDPSKRKPPHLFAVMAAAVRNFHRLMPGDPDNPTVQELFDPRDYCSTEVRGLTRIIHMNPCDYKAYYDRTGYLRFTEVGT